MRLPVTLLLQAFLVLAGFNADSHDPADPAAGEVPRGRLDPPDAFVVFVLWGGSNACGAGEEPLSTTPDAGSAYEFHWSGPPVRQLDDPAPCWGSDYPGVGGDNADDGSAWTQFAITYADPEVGLTDDVFFMTSLGAGGKFVNPSPNEDWHPTSGELYADGLLAIERAMTQAAAKAEQVYPNDDVPIVFGGVIWTQGNDLTDYSWEAYSDALHDLLREFGDDVVSTYPDARFYYINTPSHLAYPVTITEQYLDLEADVCAAYPYCSMIQESLSIREEYEDCEGDPGCEVLWYNEDDNIHWAQTALDHLGETAAERAVANAGGVPITWEVGIEVPHPTGYTDPDLAYPIRLEVYDADGDPVAVNGSTGGVAIDPVIANPDWTADFNGGAASWAASWAGLQTAFLTFEFWRDAPAPLPDVLLGRYVYVPTAVAYDTGETDFFRPEAETGPADTRFEVFVAAADGVGVRARTGFVGPSFEAAFGEGGPYVVPYNHDHFAGACDPDDERCPDGLPGYFLARLPITEDRPDDAERRLTFADEANVVLPSSWGSVPWNVPNLVLAFPDTRRLIVEGALDATDVTLTKAGTQGWGGVVFRQPAGGGATLASALHGSTVEHVRGLGPGLFRGGVEVHNRTLMVDEAGVDVSEIRSGTNGAVGLLATGTALVTVTGGSRIRENAGGGVYASGGADVTVEGLSEVNENGVGGVRADGYGTLVALEEAFVLDNGGPGVRAHALGQVAFANASIFLKTEVKRNAGGLYATGGAGGGGSIHAGMCNEGEPAPCQNRTAHELFDNGEPGTALYDARSAGGASLYAQGNDWDVTALSALNLQNQGSTLVVCPLVNGTCGSQGRQAGGLPHDGLTLQGGGSAPRLTDVFALVDEAERARLAGDMDAFELALVAIVVAMDTSATEDERRAAFEAAARLFAGAQPEGPLAALGALAGEEGEARPWAWRALGVARASAGDHALARAAADTLVAAYALSEHAEYGYGLAVRVSVEEGDEASAVAALAALAAFPFSEEVGGLAALVVGAFPEVDLSGLGGSPRLPGKEGAASATAPASTASSGPTAAVSAEAGPLLDVGEARPNPATGAASVPFVLSSEAEVSAALYDALGRRVAVLASGRFLAGRHALTLDAASLPSGVHVVARGASGSQAAVRRITLAH